MIEYQGKQYHSYKEICEKIGVKYKTFCERRTKGLSIEQSLSTQRLPASNYVTVTYKGITYSSYKELYDKCCTANISYGTFHNRVFRKYCSLEDALTLDKLEKRINNGRTKIWKDHLGHEYEGLQALCDAWGLTIKSYQNRIRAGYSLKDTLEGKVVNHEVIDHNGIKHDSELAMCRYYNIDSNTYRQRVNRRNWSMQKALETPVKQSPQECYDPFGRKFDNLKAMYKYYNASYSTITRSRHPLMATLKLIPLLGGINRDMTFRKNFFIRQFEYIGTDDKEYWSCVIDEQELILSKEEIYQKMENIVMTEYRQSI